MQPVFTCSRAARTSGKLTSMQIAQPKVRPSARKVTGSVPGVYIQETPVSGRCYLP